MYIHTYTGTDKHKDPAVIKKKKLAYVCVFKYVSMHITHMYVNTQNDT